MSNEIVLVVLAEYEEAAVGNDLIKVVMVERRRMDIGRIASEAEARLDFLRSRPLSESPSLRGRERAVIEQLQALAWRARAFIDAVRDGTIGEPEAAIERGALDKLAFAAVHRFSALLEALDEPFPTRVAPPNPARRGAELAAIERFLARKARREVA